jgi:hypothetical protein
MGTFKQTWRDKWPTLQHSPWWGLVILFVALHYLPLWWRTWHADPFVLDTFTDALLLWNQRLLHAPIFLCLYGVFAKRWTWFGLAGVFAATWVCTDLALFDIHLHELISSFDGYPKLWHMPNGETNSNYAKIAVFLLIFPIFLLRFLQREYRTFDRAIALLMTCSVIGTALLFHWLWIPREYKMIAQREMQHIAAILPLDEASFKAVCRQSDWGCWIGYPAEGKDKNPLISDLIRKDIQAFMASTRCDNKLCVKISGSVDPAQNEFSPMPLGAIHKDGQWRFIVDHRFVPTQFLEIRQGLTTLGIVAGNVWIYGLIFLWAAHRWAFKRRQLANYRLQKGHAS